MGITVSFDDSSDAVTTLSKESLMTDYTTMPNYKADKAQAYANMEKLLPFYNKEQIIKYGNLATGKLASQVLVSVTPMMGSNYVTDYSQPMDRIMLHYADKSVQYLVSIGRLWLDLYTKPNSTGLDRKSGARSCSAA